MIFINLYNTKEEALSTRYSPNTSIFEHRGIQLLSENELKYIQPTNVPDGIELEDWAVFAVSLCGSQRTDISEKFMIERVYQDDNGVSQIEWSLTDLPDLGTGLVYLEVNQLLEGSESYADTWYSNVFSITNYESEYTSRIDYRDDASETMFSTQLGIYFWQNDAEDSLSSYTEIGTGTRRTIEATYSEFETWDMVLMPKVLALKFKKLFINTFVYINLTRAFPFNQIEIPKLEAQENFVKVTFDLSFDNTDIYDPNFVPPLPDVTPRIVFNEIQYLGNNDAVVYFDVLYFEPYQLVVQRSTDGINWLSSPILDEGGQAFYSLQYAMGTQMQLRIRATVEDINSNILPFEVEVPDTIAGVTAVFVPELSRWRITVNYSQSYYNGVNVVMITQVGANNAIETTEVNDGSVSRNIIGSPGNLVKVSLRATDNSFQSEVKTITLTL